MYFLCSVSRVSNASSSDTPVSPYRDPHDALTENIQLHELEVITTLGMGGFGRVELVSLSCLGVHVYMV